jgi:hypothetical protein
MLLLLLCLSQACFLGRNVTPLLDDGLLDLPGVGAGTRADLLGDVDTLLLGLEEGHQLGDVLARSLGLQVAVFLWHLLNNGFLLVEALLGSGGENTTGGSAELPGHLLTLGLGGVLLHLLLLSLTDLTGPLGTLLFGGVSLGNILAFLVLDGLALNNVILDIVLVVSGLAHALVHGLALLGALSLADERGVTELDLLIKSNLLVFDEAVLDEVLLALFLLLGLEVGGVGGVAPLAVAVLALNDVIVFGLFDHHDLVDTTLTGGGDGSDVEFNISLAGGGSLTGVTGWGGDTGECGWCFVGVIVFVSVGVIVLATGGCSCARVEGEGVGQTLLVAATLGIGGGQGDQTDDDG